VNSSEVDMSVSYNGWQGHTYQQRKVIDVVT